MISCSRLSGILIALYFFTSLYYLYLSSLPVEPCINDGGSENISCIKPLLYYHKEYTDHFGRNSNQNIISSSKNNADISSSSTFILELLVPTLTMNKSSKDEADDEVEMEPQKKKKKKRRPPLLPQLTWTKVSSCFTTTSPSDEDKNDEMSFEIDDFLAKEYEFNNESSSRGINDSNRWLSYRTLSSWLERKKKSFSFNSPTIRYECQLSFPNHIRQRNQNRQLVKPFKGKFILKQIIKQKNTDSQSGVEKEEWKDMKITIAETTFDLTRIIQKPQQNNKNQKEYVPQFKYYKQPLVLRVVTDTQSYAMNNPFRGDGYRMDPIMLHLNNFHSPNLYRPIFYVDDVALRYNSQIELAPPSPPVAAKDQQVNEKPPVKMKIKISFMKPMRHIIQRQLALSLNMAEHLLGPHELDELRYLISDEYMYRFIITQIIGFLHLALDYLAFKNEIGFYVGRGKDVTGISLSSLYSRCICDVIIFLYLLDGGNTSWFLLFSIASSILVELWKLYKYLQPKWNWKNYPYFLSFRDMSSMTPAEQMTIDYDSIARTYLSLLLYPMILGLALYGRQFYTYTSWYSWMISNLANAVYTFGFISLCPQLYINYKLKSVAHLPWRVFLYKIFNTFVDDVFAFLIEMPMKHKLMTLRDDVVFFIFLVQAYIYRVDKKRANEYGYAYEDDENEVDNTSDEKKEKLITNEKSIKVD